MKRQSIQNGVRLLWDLIPSWNASPPESTTSPSKPAQPRRRRAETMSKSQQRYLDMTRTMLCEHGVRVRKWRKASSGVAWQVRYSDGSISKLIESPRPRGPISAAIFLHEIGHHAIGFDRYKPRCLEEYHAWMYSLEQMERWGLNVTERVHDRVYDSLHYAVQKARRRGLKRLPIELAPYIKPRHTKASPPRDASHIQEPAAIIGR